MRTTGVTLIEMLIVLTILGLLAGVVGLTSGSIVRSRQAGSEDDMLIERVRQESVRSGHSVMDSLRRADAWLRVRGYPDGRVVLLGSVSITSAGSAANASAQGK